MSTAVERVTWDQYAMLLAFTATLRSEDPYTKVGACALDYSNNVLGVAYNGLKSGFKPDKEFWADRDKRRPYMVHAEANLLSLFKKDECKTIALTHSPCTACASLIIAHNIPRVIYCNEYKNDTKGIDTLKFYGVEIYNIDIKQIYSIIQNSFNIWK